MEETIQNLFLAFLNIIKSIIVVMQSAFSFYDEYGLFFLIILMVVCLIDIYLFKNEVRVNQDNQAEIKQSVYPTWKIILVTIIGYDCLFDFGLNDNTTFLILIIFTFNVLRRSLLVLKYKHAVNL